VTGTELGYLALTTGFGSACFWAGWRAAAAYLPAARAVSDVAAGAVSQANTFSAQLERAEASVRELKQQVELSTKVADAHYSAIEITVREFFEALQQSGAIVTPRRSGTPLQHGEGSPGA
jgi:hypothetical protein